MTRAFYPAEVTAFSRRIQDGLRRLDDDVRGISLLGGWAVHALVDPVHAMESQDIDILLHTTPAWNAAVAYLEDGGFTWRTFRRRDEPPARDHRLVHPDHASLAVDVFHGTAVDDDLLRRLFATNWIANLKDQPYTGFIPTLPVILQDKFETLPLRTDPLKRRKDALDAWALLFHNREGHAPDVLLQGRTKDAARRATPVLAGLRGDAAYAREIDDLLGAIDGV